MNNTCNNCKVIYKTQALIFICPYHENVFGLELNKNCRKNLINEINKTSKIFYQTVFTNLKIKKIYSKNKIEEFYKAFKFLNNFLIKFKLKKIYKLDEKIIDNLIFEPLETISDISLKNEKIYSILKKNNFFSEIIEFMNMEYDKKCAYMRLFENDIDFDERWFLKTEIIKEIISGPNHVIKIFDTGKEYFYYVKLESGNICEEGSLFSLLERMDGDSRSLRRLIAAIFDKEVQEIYLDKENSWVYLDHSKYGRCSTNIFLKSIDVEKFKTFISIVTGEEISTGQPSLKVGIADNNIKLRIAIDVFPIVEDSSLDIRKFTRKLLTLRDLVNNGSIDLDLAAFLVLLARTKCAIVICGEPNSGKTTLAHAIARHLPPVYRKIYLEDVDEVYSSLEDIPHNLYIKTSSLDVSSKYSSKSLEIVKLLHRSPDWIFLGELQTKEHTRAFFHSLLAGLRGIVTSHSSSAHELIKRWILQHSIHPSSICSLDLIVEMGRNILENKIERYTRKVYEIRCINEEPVLFEIYRFGEKFDQNNMHKWTIYKKLINNGGIAIENIYSELLNIKQNIINEK